MITKQQFLVLFDIAKSAMNVEGGFAGYTNNELMKLVNDIISQQDNVEIIDLIDEKSKKEKKVSKKKVSKKKENIKIEKTPSVEDVIENINDNNIFDVKVEVKEEEKKIEQKEEKIENSENIEQVIDDEEDFW